MTQLKKFKVTNKVTCASIIAEASSENDAFDAFAKLHGVSLFSDMRCTIFGDHLDKSLFEVSLVRERKVNCH
jgi:hypothetical protein